MDALHAAQHLPTNRDVRNGAIRNDGAGDRDRPLGVVGRLANAPLTFRVPCIPRNDGARRSFETVNAVGIPARYLGMRQRLGLLADGVADGDARKARADALNR